MLVKNYTDEPYNYCDGWGFYIDIESLSSLRKDNDDIMKEKYGIKNFNKNNRIKKYNYCETINEEYEYYCKNYDDKNEDIFTENKKISDENTTSFIIRVSSTTIITAILTYFIFIVL
jgi:hypothetical protein